MLVLALASAAHPQDFDAPAPGVAPAAARSPLALIDAGWPSPRGGLALACATTSWHAVPGLTTRAVALGGGWRALRAGAGLSQTGDAELGWNAAGAALGVASARGGAALRGVARRDRMPGERLTRLGAGVGLEAGAGAWLATAGGATLWASAPQVWRAGESPPLPRPLIVGVSMVAGPAQVWLAREAPVSRDPGGGTSVGGLVLAAGPASVWAEARDAPLRATLGLAARARGVGVAASVESHPVLGETARLSLMLGGGAAP